MVYYFFKWFKKLSLPHKLCKLNDLWELLELCKLSEIYVCYMSYIFS